MTYNFRRALKRKRSPTESSVPDDLSAPSTKRRRDSEQGTGYSRHSVYYKMDADFIIKVKQTLFRTNASELKALGRTFAERISKAQANDRQRIDGVLYCDLTADASTQEVEMLFRYLYKKVKLTSVTAERKYWIHWNACIFLLRLSERCGMGDLRYAAIEAFKSFFPLSEEPTLLLPHVAGVSAMDRSVFKLSYAIQAINLFHECNVPGLLPMAYYHAAQLPINAILEGVVDVEGVSQKLNANDTRIVLVGRELLKASRRINLFGWLVDIVGHGRGVRGSKDCSGLSNLAFDDTCYGFLLRTYLHWHRHGFFDTANSLETLSDDSLSTMERVLCNKCMQDVQVKVGQGLKKSWEATPKIFGWTGWGEIIEEELRCT